MQTRSPELFRCGVHAPRITAHRTCNVVGRLSVSAAEAVNHYRQRKTKQQRVTCLVNCPLNSIAHNARAKSTRLIPPFSSCKYPLR